MALTMLRENLREALAKTYPGVHEFCWGCKANHPFFERFCPGVTDTEWTIRKCERARAEARKRWEEYDLGRRKEVGKR
ncbi:hypothetical protein SAMN00808754_1961 [Thermanaeromonas toyohensis ToBE]|uniref:Uncharacterized protein n=1 Tax=Thermanaeromonas toyohensis ToBE TaxID=698762 RepID=A0A1W1VWS5_9FIRM|nr:hypothetical protein [Thermanaeromonas toyohensis]SMB97815.1 hypothetical protein SAMN00808754_1961 [Thermanaeromonas toyohensis ToBE]